MKGFSVLVLTAVFGLYGFNVSRGYHPLKDYQESIQSQIRPIRPYNPIIYKRPWRAIAKEQSQLRDLEFCTLVAVIVVESSEVEDAISERGAMGYAQLMPATAKEMLGLEGRQEIMHPENNIPAGAKYLKQMIDRFGKYKGIMAYNSGPGRIGKTKENREYLGKVLRAEQECQG